MLKVYICKHESKFVESLEIYNSKYMICIYKFRTLDLYI